MQNGYTGDVGDFGKYGLLNEICKKSNGDIRLGVNWFYVEGGENGKHTKYLKDSYKDSKKYRECFPELYDQLKSIVDDRKRSIKEIEKNLVLPKETVFYSKPLLSSPVDRENWFKESLTKLKKADIIFLDPDNGIQTDKVKKTHKDAIKYVFRDEIEQYYELGKSLVIYNHEDRKPRSEYNRKFMDIRHYVRTQNLIQVLRFKRFSVRYFIFMLQKDHRTLIDKVINHLTREQYSFLFEMYDLD